MAISAKAAYKEGFLRNSYGQLNLGQEPIGDPPPNRSTILETLAARPVPSAFGVANVEELFAMPAAGLVERLLSMRCLDEHGEPVLPWGGKRVAILGERLVFDNLAEVTYAHLGQSAVDYDPKTLRAFQQSWKIRLHLERGHWRMDIPEALLP